MSRPETEGVPADIEDAIEAAVDRDEEASSDHKHHLIRPTTSTRSFDGALVEELGLPEIFHDVDGELTVEDIYCFTCEEWVGVSGVPLRGVPRSTEDAYYHRGAPQEVRELREEFRRTWREHIITTITEHPHVDTPAEAGEFITQLVEDATERVQEGWDE
jgi:hypothetical protein